MATIYLPNNQRARFCDCLRRAGRREIGGVLMGEQLSVDHFKIVDFSVDEITGSAVHFVRSPESHETSLSAFFDRTGGEFRRFNYLGEWHSHPSFAVQPSAEDRASMHDLVNGERDINFAALLIVRLRYLLFLEAAAVMFVRGAEPTPMPMKDLVRFI